MLNSPADDVSFIATIDWSGHVDVQYAVVDGRLAAQPVAAAESPAWRPTGSAVGVYLRQGCPPADPVHPALFAEELDDIHLVCRPR